MKIAQEEITAKSRKLNVTWNPATFDPILVECEKEYIIRRLESIEDSFADDLVGANDMIGQTIYHTKSETKKSPTPPDDFIERLRKLNHNTKNK